MHAVRQTLIAAAAVMSVFAAQAATVTLTNITGTWFDANPAANITSNTGGGTANTSIRWGGASGYDFGAAASASATVPPSPSANFNIGEFTHVNFPIFPGTSITDVKLQINADIDVDGNGVGNKAFVFQFLHDETDNGVDPCPYGGALGVGVNINGCADKVTVSFLDTSESFTIGSDVYTVNLIGFETGSGLVSEFLTAEQAANRATLVANVTLRNSLTVPEPGSIALVGLSLLGLAATGRRRA